MYWGKNLNEFHMQPAVLEVNQAFPLISFYWIQATIQRFIYGK